MSTALPPAPPVPLYVDLDGTLVRTDTLHESVLLLLRASPLYLLRMLWWLLGGKAAFKRKVAEHACPAPEQLPYTSALLDWLRAQQAQGRPLVLATAADARIAQAVAGHLGGFADVLASNAGAERLNLSRQHKRAAIEQHARAHGHSAYAYAGNSADDLPVWDGRPKQWQ